MADISTWSPLDESNTAAPPNGWPENQPTNTVNNCGRAMMGAVRRWYDELANGTASIGYMSTSGGVFTGPVSSYSSISCNGSLQAGGTITGLGDIVAAGGITGGAITANVSLQVSGPITGFGDIVAADNITGGVITANVALVTPGNLSVGGTLLVTGNSNLNGDASVGGNFSVSGAGGFSHDLAVTGTVYAHAFADTDGALRVLDVLRDLQARVAALEAAL